MVTHSWDHDAITPDLRFEQAKINRILKYFPNAHSFREKHILLAAVRGIKWKTLGLPPKSYFQSLQYLAVLFPKNM